MRYNALCAVLGRPADFRFDLSEVVARGSRLNRWLAWRFKSGPVVRDISACLVDLLLEEERFEFAWVDKGVWINRSAFQALREKSDCLIHFTPDPALVYHQSKHFAYAIDKYDVLVTTKSYELKDYRSRKSKSAQLLLSHQGIDVTIHRSYRSFEEKVQGISFIGHAEEDRIDLLQALVDARIPIHLCGRGWKKFIQRNQKKENLHFYGTGLFGEAYGKFLSQCVFSLGFLSRLAPDRITTRTFEIPACGTILMTEMTDEISTVFGSDHVVFYDSAPQLIQKYLSLKNNPRMLKEMASRAQELVHEQFTYEKLMTEILEEIEILQ